MKIQVSIYKSSDPSDTDDECTLQGIIETDTYVTLAQILEFAEMVLPGQDQLEVLNRLRFYRIEEASK